MDDVKRRPGVPGHLAQPFFGVVAAAEACYW